MSYILKIAMDRQQILRELGLGANATPDQVRKAYRKWAFNAHPDRGGDSEKFKNFQEEYNKAFDRSGAKKNSFGENWRTDRKERYERQQKRQEKWEDFDKRQKQKDQEWHRQYSQRQQERYNQRQRGYYRQERTRQESQDNLQNLVDKHLYNAATSIAFGHIKNRFKDAPKTVVKERSMPPVTSAIGAGLGFVGGLALSDIHGRKNKWKPSLQEARQAQYGAAGTVGGAMAGHYAGKYIGRHQDKKRRALAREKRRLRREQRAKKENS